MTLLYSLHQKLTDGKPGYGCVHIAQWLPWFTKMGIQRGLIHQSWDIVQAYGNSPTSGGTHLDGNALDLAQHDPRVAALARECGAPAAWYRTPAQGFQAHTHLELDCPDCKHAAYQIRAVKAGFDGLGANGRGGKDYVTRPSVWRNWANGITWMQFQLAPVTASKDTGITITTGAGMADAQQVAQAVHARTVTVYTAEPDAAGRVDPDQSITEAAATVWSMGARQALIAANEAARARRLLEAQAVKIDALIAANEALTAKIDALAAAVAALGKPAT